MNRGGAKECIRKFETGEQTMLIKIVLVIAAAAGVVATVIIIQQKPAPPPPPVVYAPASVLRPPTNDERALLDSMATVAPKRHAGEMH
jgi:hypothetical protein